MEGCHGDGDPANNRLSNLRWDTHSGNVQDSLAHRTHSEIIKALCPRGHSLQVPNLVASGLRKGIRDCLACARARAWTHKRGLPFDPALADEKYRQIMA
jgi:hypothetical protein